MLVTGGRVITTGCRNDAASIVRAAGVIEILAEANPERTFADFRRAEDARSCRGNETAALFSLLLKEKIDIVIVDANLVPLNLQQELEIVSATERGNPFKALVSCDDRILDEKPDDVPIAVSDPASRGQLLYYRPDLLLVDKGGEFDDLVSVMERGEIGGFVADASEVEALGRQDMVAEVFTPSICMPFAGQGALVLVTRRNDRKMRQIADSVNHSPSFQEIMLERMFLAKLTRDGRGPICVLCNVDGETFQISAVVVAPDGSEKISGMMHGFAGKEQEVSGKLASYLLDSGADRLVGKC